jgi:hypothetical protein
MVERFPMSRWDFIKAIYLRVFTEPLAFLKFQQDYIDINVLGRSANVYLGRPFGSGNHRPVWPRLGAALGLGYLLAFLLGQYVVTAALGRADCLVFAGLAGTLLVVSVAWLLPDWTFFPTPFRQPYSARASGAMRVTFYTWCIVGMGLLRMATGGRSAFCFWVLWVVPLLTSFPFFLLLRDVYQHTNADDGRLTNTRVFFPDPFTRWAVFVYGQDMHLPHHLFPAVPHYRLGRLHRLLKARHAEYATAVVECHGTFGNGSGLPSILDTLTTRE